MEGLVNSEVRGRLIKYLINHYIWGRGAGRNRFDCNTYNVRVLVVPSLGEW